MKVELECKQCGKKFELESWQSKNRLFCCRQCGADNKKKNIVSKICEFCGKEFTPLSYEKNRRFCSRKCSTSRESSKKGKSKFVVKICEFCKKEYKVHLYRKDSHFCSKKCKHDAGNITISCKECGSIMIKPNWIYKGGFTEHYCEKCKKKYSPKCSMFELDVFKELNSVFSNVEQHKFLKLKNRRLHPDILIDKLIIECQGDYFHCNPSFFKEDYLNLKTNKYAKDIWKEDRERKEVFEEAGYKVFYIWESEWKKNKSNLIKKIEYEISKNQIN